MKLLNGRPSSVVLIATQLFCLAAANADEPEIVWQTNGFEEPESALYDPDKEIFYVSNIKGSPVEKDGQGYISRLSGEGKITDQRWVEHLDAPKGLAISNGKLYVADMQRLHVIDTHSGKLEKSISVPNSQMLNDIAVDRQGVVYVSDVLAGGIFQYKDKQISPWVSPAQLPHPNGLFIEGDTMFVATWGKGLQEDFSTDELGSLYQVDLDSKDVAPVKGAQHIGNLDGITSMNRQLIVNDWMNGNVFRHDENGATLLFEAPRTSADIGTDGQYLIVPVMEENTVIAYDISAVE